MIVGLAGRRGDGAVRYGNKETQQRKDIVLNVAAESAGKVEPVNTEASAASAHRDSNNKRNLRRIESEAAAPGREGHTQEQILLHNDGQPGSIDRPVSSCLPPHPELVGEWYLQRPKQPQSLSKMQNTAYVGARDTCRRHHVSEFGPEALRPRRESSHRLDRNGQ